MNTPIIWMVAVGLMTASVNGAGIITSDTDALSSITLESAVSGQSERINMNASDMRLIPHLNNGQLARFLSVLDATPLIPFSDLPRHGQIGTYYSLRHPEWPPLPGNVSQSDVWQMNDFYLLNDIDTTDESLSTLSTASVSLTSAAIPPGLPGFGDGGGGEPAAPIPDIPNFAKYIDQTFALIDTNDAAINDTNLYNAILTFADNASTGPTLQILPYQGNCLLIKASHFDYTSETTRDFALVINDKLDVPLYKSVDLSNLTTNNGWLVQGLISRYKVADTMFILISNINRTYNAFVRAVPYSGPEIQISGAQDGDVVSGILSLQTTITDLSGVTNQQIAVLVDGLPARYSLGTNNTIYLDTRYSPNGTEPVSVIAANASALLYNPSNAITDKKLAYQNTSTLSLDFENDICLNFAGNETSPAVGTNYTDFAVSSAEYIRGIISDPASGRVIKSYSGYVPSATTVSFAWDFNESDGVTHYTNDTYVFTFQANPQSLPTGSIRPMAGGATTTLVITNTIGKQGVRAGGYCILNYESENPNTTSGATINYFEQQWGDTLEFCYESLYYWQFGSLPQYSAGDIGANRSNPSNPHLPYVVDSGNQKSWFAFLQGIVTNHAYSDFNYGPGHANGYMIGSGPLPTGWNYIETTITAGDIQGSVVGDLHVDPNWRMRKISLWGCHTGNKFLNAGIGWADAFGIRDTATQLHSWTKKNVGLLFMDEINFQPYGTPVVSLPEVIMDFDTIWIDGPMAFPGGCDPTYSFQFALASAIGMYPELAHAGPQIVGFPYLPYSSIYDDELMLNDVSHVKNSFHW